MEIANLVLDYLQALIWPGITISAIVIFRKQLRDLLANIGVAVHRLKKLTAPGTTVELIEVLTQSTDQVIATEPRKGLGQGSGTLQSDPDEESLDDLTTGKIVRTWAEIDASLQALVDRYYPEDADTQYRRIINPNKAIRDLTNGRIIPPYVAENLLEARTIRNHVVHGKETIPLGAFDDYLRAISKLSDYLKNAIEVDPTDFVGQRGRDRTQLSRPESKT